jgi:hypothetical protein
MDYVKWMLSAGVVLALNTPALASEEAQVEVAGPTHSYGAHEAARQIDAYVHVEYQTSLFTYRTISDAKLTVVQGHPSTITVRFAGEPYVVTYAVRGEALRAEGEKPFWAFEVVRQDTVGGEASSEPKQNQFVVEQDDSVRFRSTGWYRAQMRNFRLTFALR